MSDSARVRDYMSVNLVTLDSDTEILQAANTLLDNGIGGAPVVDRSGKLIGMLTEKDCMKVVMHAGYHSERGGPVVEFMSKELITVSVQDSIFETAKLFLGDCFHRYPVLENGLLVGQISRRDVMRALIELW